jgi:hypothetical protein
MGGGGLPGAGDAVGNGGSSQKAGAYHRHRCSSRQRPSSSDDHTLTSSRGCSILINECLDVPITLIIPGDIMIQGILPKSITYNLVRLYCCQVIGERNVHC